MHQEFRKKELEPKAKFFFLKKNISLGQRAEQTGTSQSYHRCSDAKLSKKLGRRIFNLPLTIQKCPVIALESKTNFNLCCK